MAKQLLFRLATVEAVLIVPTGTPVAFEKVFKSRSTWRDAASNAGFDADETALVLREIGGLTITSLRDDLMSLSLRTRKPDVAVALMNAAIKVTSAKLDEYQLGKQYERLRALDSLALEAGRLSADKKATAARVPLLGRDIRRRLELLAILRAEIALARGNLEQDSANHLFVQQLLAGILLAEGGSGDRNNGQQLDDQRFFELNDLLFAQALLSRTEFLRPIIESRAHAEFRVLTAPGEVAIPSGAYLQGILLWVAAANALAFALMTLLAHTASRSTQTTPEGH